MPFINIRCISQGDINSASANCISLEEFEQKYAHFALEVDDIVISTSGTLGRSAIVRKEHLPLMLNTSVIRMRSRSLGLSFLWCFLNSPGFLDEMAASANGSVQLNFGPIHLRAIRLLVPPAEVLQVFNSICEPLLRRVLSCRSESNILSAARDSLLPVLLSGELAVFEGVHHKEPTAP
jgi:type I restriction enzyme S subunit